MIKLTSESPFCSVASNTGNNVAATRTISHAADQVQPGHADDVAAAEFGRQAHGSGAIPSLARSILINVIMRAF